MAEKRQPSEHALGDWKMVAAAVLVIAAAGCALPSHPTDPHLHRRVERGAMRDLWIDLASAEVASPSAVVADLARAEVIFLGETHTHAGHHAVQLWLLQQMFSRGVRLVLCLEQLEAEDQPAIDRFNRREIDFATLAQEIDWAEKWSNYKDYRALCEFAQRHGIPLRGLNAPAELIRAVSRGGGVAQLTPEQRARLPADLPIADVAYERLTTSQLTQHANMDAVKLRSMFEAQQARDEFMAEQIVAARLMAGDQPRTAFVILGAGHMRYGLGTPAGVRRRADVVERLVLITDDGDAGISHGELRAIGRPPADYLRVLPKSSPPPALPPLPPAHPPIGR